MSWKDKWTAFVWKICFPGEAIPLDILPSNYARLETVSKVEEKLSLEDALTKAVIMDMHAYPNQWEKTEPRWTYDDYFYRNTESSDLEVRMSGTSTYPKCFIAGVAIGPENSMKLQKAFQGRKGAEVLEKLVDRIQKVENVTYEEVVEESRPKTIDPFSPVPMEKLAKQIESLKSAAEKGRNLPPPARKLINKVVTKPTIVSTKINKSNYLFRGAF